MLRCFYSDIHWSYIPTELVASGKECHQPLPWFSHTSWTIRARRPLISRWTWVRNVALRNSSCGTCRTRWARPSWGRTCSDVRLVTFGRFWFVIEREGQRMLLLTWGAWGAFFSKKPWRRNSWAPRVTCLPFQPRHSHWTRRAHFIQALMRRTALALHPLLACPCHGAWKETAYKWHCDRKAAGSGETNQGLQQCPNGHIHFLSRHLLS